jgi:hypothetical protein
MVNRFALLAAACLLIPVGSAPIALADPPPDPTAQPADDPGPPPDNGVVASGEPGVVTTPDGWILTVTGKDETQLPVPPLTTALSSREYLVGGTFTGSVKGSGKTTLTGGTLEAGYQIGCGIVFDRVKLTGGLGLNSGLSAAGIPSVTPSIFGQIEVTLKPGQVLSVPVNKKTFKATDSRVALKDVHVKIDGCAGQSFLRSYSILTSSTADTDDVVVYYGVTKTV